MVGMLMSSLEYVGHAIRDARLRVQVKLTLNLYSPLNAGSDLNCNLNEFALQH